MSINEELRNERRREAEAKTERQQEQELRTREETHKALHERIDAWFAAYAEESARRPTFDEGTEAKMVIYLGCDHELWSARVEVTDSEVL